MEANRKAVFILLVTYEKMYEYESSQSEIANNATHWRTHHFGEHFLYTLE